MNRQELASRIYELRSIILFLLLVGFGALLVFGQQIVDALWYRRRGKKEAGK